MISRPARDVRERWIMAGNEEESLAGMYVVTRRVERHVNQTLSARLYELFSLLRCSLPFSLEHGYMKSYLGLMILSVEPGHLRERSAYLPIHISIVPNLDNVERSMSAHTTGCKEERK